MSGKLNGYWKMVSNENWEPYLTALGVDPEVKRLCTGIQIDHDITHVGDRICIKTISAYRNYVQDFYVGKEREEYLGVIDGKTCMTTVSWDLAGRLVAVQKGDIEGRGWTKWVVGDTLHAELRAGGVVATQVFRKAAADLNGHWKLISNENWEAYLKALGCNKDLISRCKGITLDHDITHDGDHIVITCTSPPHPNYVQDFYVGKQREEYLGPIDGKTVLTTVSWDIGGRLVAVQKGEIEGRGWTKQVIGDELHAELRGGGVVCTQVFKRIS